MSDDPGNNENNHPNQNKRPSSYNAIEKQALPKKRRVTKIVNPMARQRYNESLHQQHPKMPLIEKFAAALLRTTPTEFVASEPRGMGATSSSMEVWSNICQRLDLQAAIPAQPLPPRHEGSTASFHFSSRAALVLEEARTAIGQALVSQWGATVASPRETCHSNCKTGADHSNQLLVSIHSFQKHDKSGHVTVTFRKDAPLTKEEFFHIRPGTVYQCLPMNSHQQLPDVMLGFVTSSNVTRDDNNNKIAAPVKNEFSMQWFRDIPNPLVERTKWALTPLQTLLSELRCFEALTNTHVLQLPFLSDLLGCERNKDRDEFGRADGGGGTHFLLEEDGVPNKKKSPFHLPTLNRKQEEAAKKFLHSPPNKITLVQGPPGTGKTTLLVSIICRYLMLHQQQTSKNSNNNNKTPKRRLLVCAPTNKAVTVLATRFMAAMNPDKCGFRALMVGDGDKLLAEEGGSNGCYDKCNSDNTQQLRSIFIYSWLQSVIDGYRTIGQYPKKLCGDGNSSLSPKELHKLAKRLKKRVESNLELHNNVLKEIKQVTKVTRELQQSGKGGYNSLLAMVNKVIKELEVLKKNSSDDMSRALVKNADVIFCTLASAGGAVLRNHKVDDLIVDEAAAATEPELYIPFHLQPSRMLCVGDPLQLPATVLSRRATDLGLTESLHERLMYRCKQEYIMLDVQYRMDPAISHFPSRQFYQDKICNGDNVMNPSRAEKASLVLDGSPFLFFNVLGAEEKDRSGSIRNYSEARCIVDLIAMLRNAPSPRRSDPQWNVASRIRVITFYQAQVSLLKRLLKQQGTDMDEVVVATVDSSQGCEADVVFVSFVRSNQNSTAGFLSDNRRMNVALTRAKYQLICVGNVDGLLCMTTRPTLHQLAQHAVDCNVVQTHSNRNANNSKNKNN